MLGASGVLMGTRFFASEEAIGHPAAKERILRASGDDTVRSRVFDISRRQAWPAPFTGRALRNADADHWLGREIDLLRQIEVEAARYAAAREAGDFDIAVVHAGEAVDLINDVPRAAIRHSSDRVQWAETQASHATLAPQTAEPHFSKCKRFGLSRV
jgi:nitronate monooxygenase